MIFVSNELLNPEVREQLRLPTTFVCFAILRGSLYKFKHTHLNVTHKKPVGNSAVYGAVYNLQDDFFHIRTLDAYHLCTKDALGRNHKKDFAHRVTEKVYPIMFKSIQDLDRLIYTEEDPIDVELYVANPNHPETIRRIKRTPGLAYRQYNGILAEPFIQQLEGIKHERRKIGKQRVFTKRR